jgi:hypothetical protein
MVIVAILLMVIVPILSMAMGGYSINGYRWRAPKSRGETHLRVSQSQVAESETWKHAPSFQL